MTNYVLFLHDSRDVLKPNSVWTTKDKVEVALRNSGLASVEVGVQSESGRIEELEGIIDGQIDQWSDAKEIVRSIVKNWSGDIAAYVNELREEFDIDENGDDR